MSLFSVSVILSPPLLLCLSFVFSCLYVILSKNYYVILFKNITFAGIMVEEALKCNAVVSILDTDVEEQIFSAEFTARLEGVKLPATKLELLVKLLRKTLDEYHKRRDALSADEATVTQNEAVTAIIDEATKQALDLLNALGEEKESFRGLGLSFEEKAFYDILLHLRDKYNFEYGEDKKVGALVVNEKCKALAKKIKELIDVQSTFTDWLNNSKIRADLNQKIFFCLHANGYPPQYNKEVFDQVMEQVKNFKSCGE